MTSGDFLAAIMVNCRAIHIYIYIYIELDVSRIWQQSAMPGQRPEPLPCSGTAHSPSASDGKQISDS